MADVLEDVVEAPIEGEDTTIKFIADGHDLNEDMRGEEE